MANLESLIGAKIEAHRGKRRREAAKAAKTKEVA